MVQVTGIHHMSLTVTDLGRSVEWYRSVLGFELQSDVEGEGFRRTRMQHPTCGLTLTFTRHERGPDDPFDESRTGLDHIAFGVAAGEDLDAFVRRLDELGVRHSPVRALASGTGGVVVLRDPDNIQLEVFALPA